MKMIRQGDVLLRPVKLPPHLTEVARGHLVLAEGEVTGHAHRILDAPDAVLLTDAENRRFLRLVGAATLTHEEHGAIVIEAPKPGWGYEHIRPREYDGEAERAVLD